MGEIYLYTGTGAGKTANILGLALRSVGHKKKAVIIQFLKWWEQTGEYRIRKRLAPEYEIYLFGRKGWHGLSKLGPADRKMCLKALDFAGKIASKKKPALLGLDELNLAVHEKLLTAKEVLDFLDSLPKETDVIITGRYAPKALMERADYVNVISAKKMPKKPACKAGIQY